MVLSQLRFNIICKFYHALIYQLMTTQQQMNTDMQKFSLGNCHPLSIPNTENSTKRSDITFTNIFKGDSTNVFKGDSFLYVLGDSFAYTDTPQLTPSIHYRPNIQFL
eukprot:TRINITY_DN88217_c0_g1_i1.p2 TRINITY_DN88217_c0_g1~~TRINITY_DN88217_c0_g1_i1.p2  ORF type:complete len:107 (-),score=3.67 TRINITY_DN88217_c0_g1_i1:102-422(-)